MARQNSSDARFQLNAVPADATGKLTIIADLNYMSFPQYVLDELFGKDVMKSEIVRIGSLRKEVQITKS